MKTTSKTLLIVAIACVLVLTLFLVNRSEKDTSPGSNELPALPSAEGENATPAPAEPASVATPTGAATVAPTNATEAAAPSGLVRYEAQPLGSKAKIEGTSSIHDWEMNSVVIGGFMEVDSNFPESALKDSKAARPNVQVFMPVRSFKSYSKKMDEIMQERMNETKHKRIEYRLIELKPKSTAGATGALQFEAIGALTINGSTKTNTMPVKIEKKDGKIKVTGNTPLKMTDFGVQPPVLTIPVLGSIKTGDDIKVSFEWVVAPKSQ